MANIRHANQRAKLHVFGVDAVTGGDLSTTEWDSKGTVGREVNFAFGALGTSGITELSVHASDTSGFTPGAGNVLYDFDSATEPADADDDSAWIVTIPEDAGRYINVVVTAGAQACDIAALGRGVPISGPSTDAKRGVADFQRGSVA